MSKLFLYDDSPSQRVYVQPPRQVRRYGCMGFLGDIFMTVITGGLWLIWVFVREMRRR
jgi:hypothetical protein